MKPRPLAPIQYTVMCAAVDTSDTLAAFPALVDRDRVKSLRIYGVTASGGPAADLLKLVIVACREKPTDAARALSSGRKILDTVNIPLIPALLSQTGPTGCGWLNIDIPLLFVADQQTRYLALILTPTGRDVETIVSLDVERSEGDQ